MQTLNGHFRPTSNESVKYMAFVNAERLELKGRKWANNPTNPTFTVAITIWLLSSWELDPVLSRSIAKW